MVEATRTSMALGQLGSQDAGHMSGISALIQQDDSQTKQEPKHPLLDLISQLLGKHIGQGNTMGGTKTKPGMLTTHLNNNENMVQ